MRMARKTILADDINGKTSDDVSTIRFALDGVSYEIDLTEANATKLRTALDDFTRAARRIGGRVRPAKNTETARIREWAREVGMTVPDRGRIPQDVRDAYTRK